jgi:hypothetical protein
VVIVGDGPAAGCLRRELPGALFLGARHGGQLARIYASLDVFAHTGAYETFGQALQEAMASGLPVVAPAAGGPLDLCRTGAPVTLCPRMPPMASPRPWRCWRATRGGVGSSARFDVTDRGVRPGRRGGHHPHGVSSTTRQPPHRRAPPPPAGTRISPSWPTGMRVTMTGKGAVAADR